MALASMEQQYWDLEEETVEVGLKRRHENRRQEMEETAKGKDDATTCTNGIESTFVITAITNTIPQLINKTEILTELPIPQPPLKTSFPEPDIQVNSSHVNGTASNGTITMMQESRHHYKDMYLEPTFQKQPTQEFFCPNCNTCIRKVVLRDSDWQFVPSPPPVARQPIVIPPEPPIRCTSCFSFLIPVGSWFNTLIGNTNEDGEGEAERDPLRLIPGSGTSTTKNPEVEGETGDEKKPPSRKLDDQGSETTKDPLPSPPSENLDDQNELGGKVGEQIEDIRVDEDRPNQEPPVLEEVVIHGKTSDGKKRSGILSPVEGELSTSAPTVAGPSERTADDSAQSGGGDNLEILKSIVYGGLAESITSLSVVTSAAGASVSSSKIIAMALANLISGLFVIIHNIWDMKAEQARTVLNENEEVDRYQKLLGKRKNFALHATFVLLSFLVFGVEPPLVYGFSFRDSDNIDYKLAVVAGASFLCISLLALGKAHIQKPESYRAYLKTLVYYLVVAFAASGISYVAGDLIAKLLDKLGLFKSESEAAFFLPFNDASEVNPTWSSY